MKCLSEGCKHIPNWRLNHKAIQFKEGGNQSFKKAAADTYHDQLPAFNQGLPPPYETIKETSQIVE
jgi:hypothetical protein